MRNIGEIISSNRKKLKLSQPMLAELLQQEGINLTVKAISKWETNATEPSVATFLAVCKILNITNIYEEYFGENPADPLSSLFGPLALPGTASWGTMFSDSLSDTTSEEANRGSMGVRELDADICLWIPLCPVLSDQLSPPTKGPATGPGGCQV